MKWVTFLNAKRFFDDTMKFKFELFNGSITLVIDNIEAYQLMKTTCSLIPGNRSLKFRN
jgi:hypothetical protein